MTLRLYNSRTRSVEAFAPLQPGKITIYVCGMTPSFHPHLGHARTFLMFDVLRRHLERKGFAVTYAQNVTDIDDKIIERAHADGVTWDAVVSRYYGEYEASAEKLGLRQPDLEPRATREVPAIVEMIQGLIAQGDAYETDDGVYFCVKCFPNYGQLSNRDVDELRAGERVAIRENKQDPLDFALWKKAKPGEPTWPSPWGPGRPGWHIECSAMSRRYLGDQIDIHGGATDLIFPHHENEVAQSESFTHKHPMANFWVHGGLLMVEGRKMSKSFGNFTPLLTVLQKYPGAAIRYLFLQTGYRKPINFTEDSIDGAIKGLRGLYAELEALREAVRGAPPAARPVETKVFDAFLDDDLNTAGAVGWLHLHLREARAAALRDPAAAVAATAAAERCVEALGLPPTGEAAGVFVPRNRLTLGTDARAMLLRAVGADAAEEDDVALVERVVSLLDQARSEKNYARSDTLRGVLSKVGIAVRNTPSGTQWSVDGPR